MTVPAALAIDIDGTLINSDKRIPEFTRAEIRRVVSEYGTRVFLVTARGPQSTSVIEQRLGVPASYATFGGALVWARTSDSGFSILQETEIPDDVVRGILRASAEFEAHVGVYTRDRWYVNDMNYWGLREARNTAVWPQVAAVDERLLDTAGHIFKVMFRGERDALSVLGEALEPFSNRAYIHNSGRVLEIISSDAVKLPAVRALCRHFSLSTDDVIAFGDSAADLEMLENVGVGVIMSNVSAELTFAPHLVRTLSNDEDGIGVAIRKYFPTDAPFDP